MERVRWAVERGGGGGGSVQERLSEPTCCDSRAGPKTKLNAAVSIWKPAALSRRLQERGRGKHSRLGVRNKLRLNECGKRIYSKGEDSKKTPLYLSPKSHLRNVQSPRERPPIGWEGAYGAVRSRRRVEEAGSFNPRRAEQRSIIQRGGCKARTVILHPTANISPYNQQYTRSNSRSHRSIYRLFRRWYVLNNVRGSSRPIHKDNKSCCSFLNKNLVMWVPMKPQPKICCKTVVPLGL